jgi:hypothetical protein
MWGEREHVTKRREEAEGGKQSAALQQRPEMLTPRRCKVRKNVIDVYAK